MLILDAEWLVENLIEDADNAIKQSEENEEPSAFWRGVKCQAEIQRRRAVEVLNVIQEEKRIAERG
jgi:hypothetical protein